MNWEKQMFNWGKLNEFIGNFAHTTEILAKIFPKYKFLACIYVSL